MQLDAILEVAIGLVFAWVVLSFATMQVQDLATSIFSWRAKFLENSVREMLKDDYLVEQFYSHPLIQSLGKFDKKGQFLKPASIPHANFAAAVLDICLNAGQPDSETPATTLSLSQMRKGMDNIRRTNPWLARTLGRLMPGFDLEKEVKLTEDKIGAYRKNVEDWFNNVMVRASAEYKQRAQTWAFIIGTVIALLFNVDTINISVRLWREPALRAAVVEQAQIQVQSNALPTALDKLVIPVGWNGFPANWVDWLYKVLGLALSGAAAMQGAPFWFDILRKLIGFKEPGSRKT
ncbi:MAG TPA: hypothetical protein VHM28_04360 [Anaerolineales bacterium]|jgi:hypothetical protein|nr:hypothetical protein [Anaerolineales bacterium]